MNLFFYHHKNRELDLTPFRSRSSLCLSFSVSALRPLEISQTVKSGTATAARARQQQWPPPSSPPIPRRSPQSALRLRRRSPSSTTRSPAFQQSTTNICRATATSTRGKIEREGQREKRRERAFETIDFSTSTSNSFSSSSSSFEKLFFPGGRPPRPVETPRQTPSVL